VAGRIADSVRDIFQSEGGSIPEYQYTGQQPGSGLRGALERFRDRLGTLPQDETMVNRQLIEAIADGTDGYIDERIARYRNITKRVIRRYIQMMAPSQDVPISGYWRVEPYEVQRSGQCAIYICDGCGGGVIPQPEEEDPGEPLCGYGVEPPFLVWNGLEHPYLPGTSNIFSRATTSEWQIARDSNGATIRNLRVNHTTEYEVVAPDRIIVRDFIEEVGGCSLFAEYALVLVRQDETVCNIYEVPGGLPVDTPEPTPPPGEERVMRVGQPFYTDEQACVEGNRPPALDDLRLTAQPNGLMQVDYAGGSQTLYTESPNFYVYSTGTGQWPRQTITLVLLDGGAQGDLAWSIQAEADASNCYVSYPLSLPGAEPELVSTPAPTAEPGSNGGAEPGTGGAMPPGLYTAEWMEIPGLCNEALLPEGPSFTEATLTQTGPEGAALTWDGGGFDLAAYAPDMYVASDERETLLASVSLMPMGDGTLAFGWSAVSHADPSVTCTLMATLTPVAS
jgi:hypothetical protein